MRVTWVNRSFLDYRVPVYAELDRLLGGGLTLIYSRDFNHTPYRVQQKIAAVLGNRAVGLAGERNLLRRGDFNSDFANASVEINWQPNLYKQIAASRPDVIIGEGFLKWTVAAITYRLRYGTPLVISYERTAHTERKSQWYRTFYRRLVIRLASAVCCNGVQSAEYVSSLGLAKVNIFTGAMAADSDGLKLTCTGISADQRLAFRAHQKIVGPLFLYVGQLVKRKGISQLIDGWALHRQRYGEHSGSLVLVGDGPERQRLKSMVDDRKIAGVRFVGQVDYDAIAHWYAAAHVFIMPTLEDNWSLVVPEAMSCGLPVLCSLYNGCWPELVHSGDNGFVFNPYHPNDIAEQLERYVINPELIEAHGRKSLEIVEDFSPTRAAQVIHNACKHTLNV